MWHMVEIYNSGDYLAQPPAERRALDEVIQVHVKPSLEQLDLDMK